MSLQKMGIGLVVGLGLVAVVAAILFVQWGINDSPDFSAMKHSVDVPIELANREDAIRKMGPDTPYWVPRNQISNYLADAVVASEDTSFFSHSGIDTHEIQEALKHDIKEGKFARGASTITQQVLKNVYLGSDKTVWRKVREIILAPRLEKALTKTEILTFYLNMAEWGPGIYGCKEASKYYFGVSPSQLSLKQSAFLAMLLPSPRRYHAYFKDRRLTPWANQQVNRVLNILLKMGKIDQSTYDVALNESLWGEQPQIAISPDTGSASKTAGSDEFEHDSAEAPLDPELIKAKKDEDMANEFKPEETN